MVKKRLIPKLLIKSYNFNKEKKLILVSSKKFKDYRIVGDPVSQARIFQSQKADELIVLFIDNNVKHREKNYKNLIQKFSSETFMPLSIGGSVKSVSDFEFLLSNGADKVIINSVVYKNINIIKKASKIFGSQCVVVSIDFIQNKKDFFLINKNKKFKVNINDYIKKLIDLGAGEIMLTDIERDGTNKGLNNKAAKIISEKSSIPIIFSGGCSVANDFIECFIKTKVSAIAAGNFFCFKDQNPLQTRSQILNSGINIRI